VGAVIVALPADAKLERLLTARGLRPHDPLDKFSDNAELAIHQLGGDVVRTNNQGDFQLIVVPGRYRLLIISHKGLRRPGVQPVDLDVNEMKKYFDNVFDLVGPNQYRWSTEEFRDAMPPFGIRFD
jgi:hypothetical protein